MLKNNVIGEKIKNARLLRGIPQQKELLHQLLQHMKVVREFLKLNLGSRWLEY